MKVKFLDSVLLFPLFVTLSTGGILYPQDSETREIKTLDGIWNFRIAPRNNPDLGFLEEWESGPLSQSGPVELMPVPSSYNDLTQDKLIRDHVGWAWYDREFRVPGHWFNNHRIWVRFGGVNYHAMVWVNGELVVEHSGGHLPFLAELDSSLLSAQSPNRITVAVNNTLSSDTIPQGRVVHRTDPRYPPGYFTLDYDFDFFNYAGIHRSVYLFSTPVNYVDDITVTTNVVGTQGIVDYGISIISAFSGDNNVFVNSEIAQMQGKQELSVAVALYDKTGVEVASQVGASGSLEVDDAKLWWPFTMVTSDNDAGYLYTLKVMVKDSQGVDLDVYRLKIGIRSVRWTTSEVLINDRPFYFRGFGRHEDFNVRGKGIDPVMLVKDHNLVKWTGANSYRTSHYPYSEELMDLTDELGIVIIDEISAVSIDGFHAELLATHKDQMLQLIQRDKNRPSVVMWSVSNEPRSQKPEAGPYFDELVAFTRSVDNTRPITIVVAQDYSQDQAAQYADVLCINRYYAWYSDTGHTEVITNSMIQDVQNWIGKFQKPLIVSEYGADTIAGMHMHPEFVFTEEFQLEYLREHFKAFDFLRKNTTFIGEMIWNFADFMTAQGITRIVGNKKGIFTRERQPKASAHLLRARYHLLANESEGYPMPGDLLNLLPVYDTQTGQRSEL